MNTQPNITQISSLRDIIQEDETLNMRIHTDNAFSLLKDISLKQYKYILFLKFGGKNMKLINLLVSIGFKPIK